MPRFSRYFGACQIWVGAIAGAMSLLPADAAIGINIDPAAAQAPISPYIYGTNQDIAGVNFTLRRSGGNRMTGYNWENNASNAGSDYLNQSDDYLTGASGITGSQASIPGIVLTKFHDQSLAAHAGYSIITLPMAGYVAADKSGPVSAGEAAPSARWIAVSNTKPTSFQAIPNLADGKVYSDELLNFLVTHYGSAASATGIKGYSLDNEPDLWSSTHSRLHPAQPLCTELITRSADLAKAVKRIDPTAETLGFVSYGFNGYLSFQNAPDWTTEKTKGPYRWFIDYYLDQMKQASAASGERLLDVLDLHNYSEAQGGGVRITDTTDYTNIDCNKARMQAPRSFWDPTYVENSWIGTWNRAFLPFLPNIQQSIATFYPGTKLGFSEYNFGGEGHVSGGIAQADILGIFGKNGVYLASLWALHTDVSYAASAFKLYRDYDGAGSQFGSTSVAAASTDVATATTYASLEGASTARLHVIVLNKSYDTATSFDVNIAGATTYATARVFAFDAQSATITERAAVTNIGGNHFVYTLPALTAAHFVLEAIATVSPAITLQPASQTTVAGNSVTFSAAASGLPTPTCQWQKDGSNISGATGATYTIASAVAGDAGSYTFVATNSAGVATSNTAVLAVVTGNGNAVAYGATNFPLGAAAGSVINFSYTVTNTGTKAWGGNHYLGLLRGDGSLVQLASVSGTAMSGSQTVIFSLPTPATAGTYHYLVQPLENGVEWFGSPVTLTLTVSAPEVSGQGNAVAYGAHSFPLSVSAGSVVNFTYTVTNAGTKAWGANHYLALLQSDYTVIQQGSLNATAVGGSKTVNFSLAAPASPGTYQYRVQGLENGAEWFGSPITLTLTVTAPAISAQGNAVAYVTNNFPLSASAGSVVNFTCNVSNLGTKGWGANHYLALMQSDYTVIQLGSLDATAAGGSKTVSLSLPVPATPGTYQYRLQPLENGVEWFGNPLTLTLIVSPAVVTAQGNAVAYGLNTFPLSTSAGSVVDFNYNVTNLGTKTWGANHYLALLDPGFNLIEFADLTGIAAGGSTTARLSFPVPATPGTYQYIVRPLENGVEWFGTQLSLTLIVTPAVVTAQGNALGYGTTTFPTTVNAGATVNFTYTTTNLGTRTWGVNHFLALLDPNYNLVDFGDLATTTAGASKVASVSFTAPVTPGTYHYILRPLENGIEWFGTEVHLALRVQ